MLVIFLSLPAGRLDTGASWSWMLVWAPLWIVCAGLAAMAVWMVSHIDSAPELAGCRANGSFGVQRAVCLRSGRLRIVVAGDEHKCRLVLFCCAEERVLQGAVPFLKVQRSSQEIPNLSVRGP